MSNSAGIAVTAEPLSPSRAVGPRAPARPAPPPQPLKPEAPAPRQGRPARFQERLAQRPTDDPGSGKRLAQHLQPAPLPGGQGQPHRLMQATSAGFLTQLLAQTPAGESESPLQRHRDGPGLGSSAYRRAGGEPPVYPETATLVRLAV